jgi:hypothetical protein
MGLSIYDVLYHRKPDYISAEPDIRNTFGDLAAMGELAYQILEVRNHPAFPELRAHLRLLTSGEPAQNRATSKIDQDADKIFELLTACLAMRCGFRIKLDDPVHSSAGKNPDVLATKAGRPWGIACKAAHSTHPESLFTNAISTGGCNGRCKCLSRRFPIKGLSRSRVKLQCNCIELSLCIVTHILALREVLTK